MTRRNYWSYIENLITEDSTSKPQTSKKFWTYIKSKRSKHSGVSPLKSTDESSVLVTDDRVKASILNNQFQSAFSAKEELTQHEFDLRCPMPPIDADQPLCEELTITTEGVQRLLLNLDPSKASGPDNIAPRVLKELASEIAPALTLLYQTSLNTGVIPSEWKIANVTPVFKKGERSKPENYRPISLTSVPCKLLEHIIVGTIMDYCDIHNIICPQQHGFRRGHSCETQLLGLVDEITQTMDKGGQEDLIVLDFSKAFDKVCHSLLVNKLHHYGIRGKINTWIKNFLTDRQQAVVVNGEMSTYVAVESGVPQGSVLGPSLFLLLINDLPGDLTCTSRLFADDTACHSKIITSQDHDHLQEDLDKLALWEHRWKMSFNPAKCSVMHMSRRQSIYMPAYYLHGQRLENATHTKYLGVTMSNNMKWNEHIKNTSSKANKTLGFLKRNLKTSSKYAKLTAYKALVRPILEYASPVWDPYTNEGINEIEKVQRRAARWITNKHDSNMEMDMQILGLPSLENRRNRARLSAFYKLHHGKINVSTRNKTQLSTRMHRHTQ